MSEQDINRLIKKYSAPYVPGELPSRKTNNIIKKNQRNAEKIAICDDLLYECNFLNFTHSQKEFIYFLVNRFSDKFKKLHGRAKKETIILAFIFYVKKLEDSRLILSNYSICKKYGLTDKVFILIVCRMCDEFVKSSPIVCMESTKFDHEILLRNGGKF